MLDHQDGLGELRDLLAPYADQGLDERAQRQIEERLDAQAASLLSQPSGPRTRRWLRAHVLGVALAMVAGGVGIATAATLVLRSGDPVPESTEQRLPSDLTEGRPRVIVTASDPGDGIRWGIAAYRTARGLTCAYVGRTQAGRLGVVGRDGAFDDDGRFHPLSTRSTRSMACGGGDPSAGEFAMGGSGPPQPAHGFSGDPSVTVAGRRIAGCTPPFERRAPDLSRCLPSQMRVIRWGFAGGDAVRVELRNAKVRRSFVPPRGSAGAYLFVLREDDVADGGPLRLRMTYGDGKVCDEARLVRVPAPRTQLSSLTLRERCPRPPQSHEAQPLLMP